MLCVVVKVMREEWEKYLLSKVELRGVQTSSKKKKPKEPKGYGILDGAVPVTPAQNSEASSVSKQEHDALLAAASEIRNRGKVDDVAGDNPETYDGSKGHGKARGKGRNKKRAASVQHSGNKDNKNYNKAETKDEPEIAPSGNEGPADDIHSGAVGCSSEGMPESAFVENGVLWKHNQKMDATQLKDSKPLPHVHFYALESDQPILDVLKPSAIVVYHPDVRFVREIEVYKAENPSMKLKVYFLFYEESTEVQKFEASIRRENGAFESLIRQKSLMMIPIDQV